MLRSATPADGGMSIWWNALSLNCGAIDSVTSSSVTSSKSAEGVSVRWKCRRSFTMISKDGKPAWIFSRTQGGPHVVHEVGEASSCRVSWDQAVSHLMGDVEAIWPRSARRFLRANSRFLISNSSLNRRTSRARTRASLAAVRSRHARPAIPLAGLPGEWWFRRQAPIRCRGKRQNSAVVRGSGRWTRCYCSELRSRME